MLRKSEDTSKADSEFCHMMVVNISKPETNPLAKARNCNPTWAGEFESVVYLTISGRTLHQI